jgi:hypothetical protein
MCTAFGCSTRALTDGSKPRRCRIVCDPTGSTAAGSLFAPRRDNVTRQRDDAQAAGRSLFERQHVVYEEPRRERHDDLLNTRSIEHHQHPMRKFVLILAARLGDDDESCCSFSLSRLRGADFGRELMHALPDHLCLT